MTTAGQNEFFTESGVNLKVSYADKKVDRLKKFNQKLSMFRELALMTLKLEVDRSQTSQYFCFDVLAATGVTGLQWKMHLGDKVTVTCGDRSDGCVRNTCDMNNVKVVEWNQTEGSQRDATTKQSADCIYVSSLQPKVLLHTEAFDFIYLHVHNNISSYIDSVFTNIRTEGVACLLFPNIASQCFRSPKLIQRQFYAHTQKTVYVTEMAARIVIADIARTAGRHGRAIELLYTLYAQDQFFIVVKIKKGSQMAFNTVDKCRPILHCLMCEERVIYPDSHCPIENPYSVLPCDCYSQNPGKTAVILGPLWIGPIYNVPYLKILENRLKREFPNSSGLALLNTVLTEAICDQSLYALKVSSHSKNGKHETELSVKSDEPASKRQKLEDDEDNNQTGGDIDTTESQNKDKTGDKMNGGSAELVNKEYEDMPLFYYHLHQQRYSIVPRCDVVVARLKEAGFRASRTHFEPHSIRTNATLKQMQTIIETTTKQK